MTEALPVQIIEDGRTMRPVVFITPEDYQDADDADGLWPALKGVTPLDMPTLDQADVDGRN